MGIMAFFNRYAKHRDMEFGSLWWLKMDKVRLVFQNPCLGTEDLLQDSLPERARQSPAGPWLSGTAVRTQIQGMRPPEIHLP